MHDALADGGGAAIGSRFSAELYRLPVLRDNVQDLARNATRFVVVGSEDAPRTGRDKTTIAFGVHEEQGALRRVLQILDDSGVNLSRIESRPSRQRAWDYVFIADLDGHREDQNVMGALAIMAQRCPMLRMLGSYPREA